MVEHLAHSLRAMLNFEMRYTASRIDGIAKAPKGLAIPAFLASSTSEFQQYSTSTAIAWVGTELFECARIISPGGNSWLSSN